MKPARTEEAGLAPRRRLRWLALALLAGYLLFCHGCHGDEDNELFAAVGQQVLRLNHVAAR